MLARRLTSFALVAALCAACGDPDGGPARPPPDAAAPKPDERRPALFLVRRGAAFAGEALVPEAAAPVVALAVEHPPGTVLARCDGPGPLRFAIPAAARGTVLTRATLEDGTVLERRTDL